MGGPKNFVIQHSG